MRVSASSHLAGVVQVSSWLSTPWLSRLNCAWNSAAPSCRASSERRLRTRARTWLSAAYSSEMFSTMRVVSVASRMRSPPTMVVSSSSSAPVRSSSSDSPAASAALRAVDLRCAPSAGDARAIGLERLGFEQEGDAGGGKGSGGRDDRSLHLGHGLVGIHVAHIAQREDLAAQLAQRAKLLYKAGDFAGRGGGGEGDRLGGEGAQGLGLIGRALAQAAHLLELAQRGLGGGLDLQQDLP